MEGKGERPSKGGAWEAPCLELLWGGGAGRQRDTMHMSGKGGGNSSLSCMAVVVYCIWAAHGQNWLYGKEGLF